MSAGSFLAGRQKWKLRPSRASTASITLSTTRIPGTTLVIWNERAKPSLARA